MRAVPEILAPAGNEAMLCAAVYSGAHAVYLGLSQFNARRSAGNFDAEALRRAVSFCHARDARVYVTLNTTLYPAELGALAQSIAVICAAGADAVIVQDLATAALVRKMAPTLALHGSTQMSVHSPAGAKMLAEMGFTRVILARELSLAEIIEITAACSIETEVFVHGALCVSVSGQCYMSAFLGGRSGNRGMCAGPCRLPVSANEQPDAHHLSLKDLSLINHLPALRDAGVTSVKLEGRLRSPEYAAGATDACLRVLAGEAYDAQLLQDVFSRSGFTQGYFENKIDAFMFGTRAPDARKASEKAEARLRELFRRERPRVGVRLSLRVSAQEARLSATDADGHCIESVLEKPFEEARGDSAPRCVEALQKTGGTPFYTEHTEIDIGDRFVPVSDVDKLRREVLTQLLQQRSTLQPLPCAAPPTLLAERHAAPPAALWAQFESVAQMPENADCDALVLPLAEWESVPAPLRAITWLAVPRALFGKAEQTAAQQIEASRTQGFAGYFVQNIGHFWLCKGLPMCGGFGLNVTNPLAAAEYARLGAKGLTLSPELTLADMARIAPAEAQTMALVYGHLPLMMTRACPLQNTHDCSKCDGSGVLLDRKQELFPVRCTAPGASGVRTIHNPIALYMGDKWEQLPVDAALAHFTIEAPGRAAQVLALLRAHAPFDTRFTRGLYYRGTQEPQ